MRHHQLPTEYKKALDSKDSFCLVIMGKDPYPKDAVGIPFCKPSWDSMCDKRISGLFVLQSIGLDVTKMRADFKSPVDCFFYLAKEKGVIFLNRSYHYLSGSVKKVHAAHLHEAEKVNRRYLVKSLATVLCGKWQQLLSHEMDYPHLYYAIHPDNRNRYRDSWSDWWSEGALKKKFRI